MSRIRIRKLSIFTIAALLVVSLLATSSAYALSRQYYDNSDLNGQNGSTEIAGVVGRTIYVTDASLFAKAYFNTRAGGVITISDYAFCPANTRYDDNGNSGANGENITEYTIRTQGNAPITRYGKKNTDCRNDLTFNVSFPVGSSPDADSGYYEAVIDVAHSNGSNVQNMFRMSTDGVAISHAHSPGSKGSEVTVEQVNASPANITYTLPFGADCSVTTKNKPSKITLFDLDNNGGSGAQLNGKVTVELRVNGSGVRKITTNSNMTGLQSSMQPNGDNRTLNIWFHANPGEKYQLLLKNAYHNNTIQYNLPFDGIFFQRDCQKWEVEANAFIKKSNQSSWRRVINVRPGNTVNFKEVAENVSASQANTNGLVEKNWRVKDIPNTQLEPRWPGSERPQAALPDGYNEVRTINIDNLNPGEKQDNYVPSSFTIPENVPYTGIEYYTETETRTRTEVDPDTGEEVEVEYQVSVQRSREVTKYWNPPEGTQYCVRYTIDPAKKNGANGRFGRSQSEVCAIVGNSPDDFNLTPTVFINPRVYSYYPNINVTGQIAATPSNSSVSGSHAWEMYAVRYGSRPESLIMKTDTGPNVNPCRRIPAGDVRGDCELFSSNTLPPSYTNTVAYRNGGPDELGSALCFFIRVQSPDESMDGRWRLSDMDCAISGVSPRIQVWGGDAKVAGDIETVTKTIEGKQIGSWGEYGVFSNGTNYNMGSGAGLRDAPTSRSVQDWNAMTFANNSSSTYGRFAGNLALPTINNEGTRVTGDITINDVDNIIDIDGRDSIVGNDIRGIVNITGTLRITNDLRYPAVAATIRNIPRVILIANDIVIESDVTEIDPWIVSRNTISTCGDDLETPELDGVPGIQPFNSLGLLSSAKCSTQLKFNGPVIAPKIYMYRTFDRADGSAAEVFNLRASNFLSSFVGTGIDEPIASTDSIQETAPRF